MSCTNQTASARHKRGDSFVLAGQIEVVGNGSALTDLTGWTCKSQLRDSRGRLIADLTFTWLDASQRLCRLSAPSTSHWPIGPAEFDMQLTSPAGEVVSTSTVTIEIVRDVTA